MIFHCHHGLRPRARFMPSSLLSDEFRIVLVADTDWTHGANPYLIIWFKPITHGLLSPVARFLPVL